MYVYGPKSAVNEREFFYDFENCLEQGAVATR